MDFPWRDLGAVDSPGRAPQAAWAHRPHQLWAGPGAVVTPNQSMLFNYKTASSLFLKWNRPGSVPTVTEIMEISPLSYLPVSDRSKKSCPPFQYHPLGCVPHRRALEADLWRVPLVYLFKRSQEFKLSLNKQVFYSPLLNLPPLAQPSLSFVCIFKNWRHPLINPLFLYPLLSAGIADAGMPKKRLRLSNSFLRKINLPWFPPQF